MYDGLARLYFIDLSFRVFVFRSKVSTISTGYPLQLRPQSVVVLTDTYIEPESPITNAGGGTEFNTKLISLMCVFILTRWIL